MVGTWGDNNELSLDGGIAVILYYVKWMVVTLHLRGIKGLEEYLQTRLPLFLGGVTVVQYNKRIQRPCYLLSS
jgi:hypothetical protein